MAVKFKEENQALYLKDVTLYWASILQPKPNYAGDANEFIANVIVSASDAKALKKVKLNKELKEIGVDVDENLEMYPDHEGSFLFKAKCPEFTNKGKKLQVKVVDKEGKDVTQNVGNGSKANLKFFVWEATMGAAKGKLNSRLNVVQVTDLIPYNDASGGFDDELGIDLSNSKPDDMDDFDDDDIPFDQ